MTLSATAFILLGFATYLVGYLGGKSSAKYDVLELKLKLQRAELTKEERQ